MARVTRCRVFINGPEFHDFKNVKIDDREVAKVVKLMNKTDWADVVPENVFSIDYVVKAGTAEFDPEAILNGTAVVKIAKKGGGSYLFQNCKILKIGGEEFDGEKELVKTLTIFAERRSDV